MKLVDSSVVYKNQEKYLVAVDCIIFGFDSNKLKLLLFKRKVEPLKGKWSLIGAFIKENMTINDAAKIILEESTGLKDVYLQEVKTYSETDRDPGERVISVGYYSLLRIDGFKLKSVEKFDAKWFDLDEIPELILDHKQMVDDAIQELRKKAKTQLIGIELLPENFTIPQLQQLYECIYNRKIDNRNFRKKIVSFDLLINTGEKDKSSSKKGAFLYKFNREKFNKFTSNGQNFEL